MHTVKSFEDDLEHLFKTLFFMKNRVLDLVKLSEESICRKSNQDIYNFALKKDKEINELENKVSDEAIELLALRQPMAKDLRLIVSSIKIASLLERIGDKAKKIIKHSTKLPKKFKKNTLAEIIELNNLATQNINDVFNNIKKYSFEKLKQAYQDDDKIDEIYSKIMKDMINKQTNSKDNLTEFISTTKIIKDYERIGDYSSKIAKVIFYMAEGDSNPDKKLA